MIALLFPSITWPIFAGGLLAAFTALVFSDDDTPNNSGLAPA